MYFTWPATLRLHRAWRVYFIEIGAKASRTTPTDSIHPDPDGVSHFRIRFFVIPVWQYPATPYLGRGGRENAAPRKHRPGFSQFWKLQLSVTLQLPLASAPLSPCFFYFATSFYLNSSQNFLFILFQCRKTLLLAGHVATKIIYFISFNMLRY